MDHIQKSFPVCRQPLMRTSFEQDCSPMCAECESMLSALSPNSLSQLPRVLNDNFQKLHLETVLIGQRLSITIWNSSTSCTLCSRLYYQYGHYADRNDKTPVSIYCSIRPDRFFIWTGASPDGQRLLGTRYGASENFKDKGLGTTFTRSKTPPKSPFDQADKSQPGVAMPPKHSQRNSTPEFLADHKMIIFSWLLKCSSEHRCRTANGFLPSRLVYVGNDPSQTKLVYSNSIPTGSDRRYMSLSHSWGKVKFTTLTRANHDRFLESISQHDLTMVFKDAMMVCRLLKIPYIWIDSLCIIQDSENGLDWKKEAPKMAQVYQNSQLNIAASGSYRGADGLIQPCRWPLHHPCWFQTQDGGWWVCDRDSYPPFDSFRFSDQPLHQRGWVMQELFLAPRTLHFTQDGLVWQCKNCVWTEFAPAILKPSLSWRPVSAENEIAFVSDVPSSGIAAVFHALSALPKNELEEEWFSLARMFVMCEFTYHSDRATALIGMARTFEDAFKAKNTQTEYIWGFWKHRIIWDLAWNAVTKVEQDPRDLTIAPSWSWMTLLPSTRGLGDRALHIAQELQKKNPGLHNRKVVDLARIVEVGARFPLAEDGTSRTVSKADYLKISGPVITVRAIRSPDPYHRDAYHMSSGGYFDEDDDYGSEFDEEDMSEGSNEDEDDEDHVDSYDDYDPWIESYKYLHLQHHSKGKQSLHLGRSECYADFDRRDVGETSKAQRKAHLEVWLVLYAERLSADEDGEYTFHGLILEPREQRPLSSKETADIRLENLDLVRTGVIHMLPMEDISLSLSEKNALQGPCNVCRQKQRAGEMQNAYEFLMNRLNSETWEEISDEVTIY